MARGRRKGPVYRDLPNERIPKPVKGAALGAIVVSIILLAAGVAYTYFYSGETQPSAVAAPVNKNDLIGQIKPYKPAANAKESASVESFSSLAQIGSEASIYVKTLPQSKCKIELLYYNTTPATDPGLEPATADAYGTAGWTWKVGPAAPEGLWPVNITCALDGKSAFVQTHLAISK